MNWNEDVADKRDDDDDEMTYWNKINKTKSTHTPMHCTRYERLETRAFKWAHEWPHIDQTERMWILSINWYAHIATSKYDIFLRIAFVYTIRKCLFIFRQKFRFIYKRGCSRSSAVETKNENKNKQLLRSKKKKIVHELWVHFAVFPFIENACIENTLKW